MWGRLLLDGLMLDLLRLNSSLWLVLYTMLLLNRLRLLGLLSDVLWMLLLDVLLGVLLGVLGVLRMLRVRVLRMLRLLSGVLRHGHRGLDATRVLLLVVLLGRGLSVLAIVNAGVGATIHVRLGLGVAIVLLLAVP